MRATGSRGVLFQIGVIALVAVVTAVGVLFLTGTVTTEKLIGRIAPKLISPISQEQPSEAAVTPSVGPSPISTGGKDFIAVYVAGGKVYFGQTDDPYADPVVLRHVYVLRVTVATPTPASDQKGGEGAIAGSAPQTDFELVRLSDQFPSPTDRLDISRARILFWEPLAADSRVITAIEAAGGT